MNAKFDQMLKLEDAVRINHALAAGGSDGATRARGEDNLAKTKAELFALLDSLTPTEVAAFGEYRRADRAAAEAAWEDRTHRSNI